MLPPEIWHHVVDVLVAREDGSTLFRLALANRTLANIALPRLYRQDALLVDGAVHYRRLTRYWQSIIFSAKGTTAFPYCLWLKSLSLWSLDHTLRLARRNRDIFGDLGFLFPYFCTSDGDHLPGLRPCAGCRRGVPHLNGCTAALAEAGKIITHFLAKSVSEGQRVWLVALQVAGSRVEMIPDWVACLPTLEQLEIVPLKGKLTGEVQAPSAKLQAPSAKLAIALRDHCPRFSGFSIIDVGWTLADTVPFFRKLRPGCLEVFRSFRSRMALDDALGPALGTLSAVHGSSLKRLEIDVSPSTLWQLGDLRGCVSVERVDLYGPVIPWYNDYFDRRAVRPCRWVDYDDKVAPFPLSDEEFMPDWTHTQSFAHTVAWLGNCTSLTSLTLAGISNSGPLLLKVLRSPNLRLRCLHVFATEPDYPTTKHDACLISSLRFQPALECFTFGWRRRGLHGWQTHHPGDLAAFGTIFYNKPGHDLFIRKLCQLRQLRELHLLDVALSVEDVDRMAHWLPNLEVLMFDTTTGRTEGDALLDATWEMRKLRTLYISGKTWYTVDGIKDYVLAASVAHPGMRINLGGTIGLDSRHTNELCQYAHELGVRLKFF